MINRWIEENGDGIVTEKLTSTRFFNWYIQRPSSAMDGLNISRNRYSCMSLTTTANASSSGILIDCMKHKWYIQWINEMNRWLPAWVEVRRWRPIPDSSPLRGRGESRPSWRGRDSPGPVRPSPWRSRARDKCALCPVVSPWQSITSVAIECIEWPLDGVIVELPSRRQTWLWCTRRTATLPANRWRGRAAATRRLGSAAGCPCAPVLWWTSSSSCSCCPSRPPGVPTGSTGPLRCRRNAPDCCSILQSFQFHFTVTALFLT